MNSTSISMKIMKRTPLLTCDGVTKIYGRDPQAVTALSNIALQIWPGEFVALMGPSGSGKTTLLNLIAGIDTPSKGLIKFAEEIVSEQSECALTIHRQHHVGQIFQFFYLLPHLTALENVLLPGIIAGEADIDDKAKKLLKSVRLESRIHHYPSQLSGGEQQRVALTRALINDPLLVLGDEPTGNLDKQSALLIWKLLKQQTRAGKAVMVATHNPEVKNYADRFIYLEGGKIK